MATQAGGRRARLRPEHPTRGSVVVFAGLDWWYHNHAHSDFQLALRLAKHRRVLVVNNIGTRLPVPGRSTQVAGRIKRKVKSFARLVRRPRPDLRDFFVYSPVTIPLYGSAWGRRLNAALLRAQLRVVIFWLRLGSPDMMVTPPTAWQVVRRLAHDRLVFNRSDKHSAWAEVDQSYLEGLERQLLSRSDAVLYVAHSLMDEDAPLVGERAVFLDHGVDLAAFSDPGAIPIDLTEIPRPRVGYIGALRDHVLDVHLLERVAREVPEVQLVLIGPSTMPMARLTGLPNVHWLGQRPHEQIPAYGAGLDVALMPWLDNEWIRACNPIKMKEYLALGLRTVTTDFPEARRYAELLDIATDSDDFVRLVRAAIGDSDALVTQRRAAVAGDSWDVRAEQLLCVLDAAMSSGRSGARRRTNLASRAEGSPPLN